MFLNNRVCKGMSYQQSSFALFRDINLLFGHFCSIFLADFVVYCNSINFISVTYHKGLSLEVIAKGIILL